MRCCVGCGLLALTILCGPGRLEAEDVSWDHEDEEFHFLRRVTVPRLELGGGLAWRIWRRETEVANAHARARSRLEERDDSFAVLHAGARADWLRLSGSWRQGIDAIDAGPSWGLSTRLDVVLDQAGYDPWVIRLAADIDSAEAEITRLVDDDESTVDDRRYTQRYTLDLVGGFDWRFAGAYSGFFYEQDRTPSVVAFRTGDNATGLAAYDAAFTLHKWGMHIGYDWLAGRRWRRGPYLGPFISGRLAWSYADLDLGDAIRQQALASTGASWIREPEHWQFDGHLETGLMWQDGSRRSGGAVFQAAVGGRLDWLVLLDGATLVERSNESLLLQYDLDGWGAQAFGQLMLVF